MAGVPLRILFDHNVDRRLGRHLVGHTVSTARRKGWDRLANGRLLRAAADAGFEVFLTVDKNIEHEQNLRTLPLPVMVIDARSNALPKLLPFVPHLIAVLA